MILKAITIENFKGICEPVRVEFKPITLLFGPNSAGKSTVIQALHYAREIFERHNLDADITQQGGEYVDLGGFRNLLFKHDERRSVKLTFDMKLDPDYELREYIDVDIHRDFEPDVDDVDSYAYDMAFHVSDIVFRMPTEKIETAKVSILITWSSIFNRPYIAEYETGFNGEEFARIKSGSDGKRIYISYINFGHPLFALDKTTVNSDDDDSSLLRLYDQIIKKGVFDPVNDVEVQLGDQKDALPKFGEPLHFFSDDFKGEPRSRNNIAASLIRLFYAYMSQLLVAPGEALREALRSFRYLGPIRETPPRNYETPRYHEHARWSNGLAAWDVINAADSDFINNVNEWMHNRLKSGYTVASKVSKELELGTPLYNLLAQGLAIDDLESISDEIRRLPERRQIVLIDEQRNLQVMPQDVGIGISQVLPVIVASLAGERHLVAIEQPELHIHPAFQVALGDLFISQIKRQDVCFLLETHSEHLLLRLMRRIRETNDNELPPDTPELRPEELAIHYVEQTDKGMQLSSIRIDKDGDFIDKWPRGFFSERFGELY